jgi:hypothetical protein
VALSNIQLPDDKTLARRIVDSQAKRDERKTEMGMLGRIFGSVSDKPGNIAGVVVLASFAALLGLLATAIFKPDVKMDVLLPIFTGMITLALGYLFGKGDQK